MNPVSKQQGLVHWNPTGSCRTKQLGSGKPSLLGLVGTQPAWSRRNLPLLGSRRPSQAGFVAAIRIQPGGDPGSAALKYLLSQTLQTCLAAW
ncbi:hypothetical protein SLEP1_g25143 [Rubroshorea leprosula]|uniref:Uncharacterized protein n=1 Tax=Rubroshorea leprosula TaxID=152421 RepID=A0AAV5JNB0_9ROSI|nr:hypothetical protein SLEP1_g25143 [Rubroshorea leprosula]